VDNFIFYIKGRIEGMLAIHTCIYITIQKQTFLIQKNKFLTLIKNKGFCSARYITVRAGYKPEGCIQCASHGICYFPYEDKSVDVYKKAVSVYVLFYGKDADLLEVLI